MASLTERMIGAATLQVATYEEVEKDTTATGQAVLVVVLSSLAAGIGTCGMFGFSGLLKTTLLTLVGWGIWVGLIFLIGTKLLPEPQTRADLGEVLRTTGFAYSPGVLRVFGIIPLIGWLISFAVSIWILVTMVIAVRQALDYTSTGRAIGVCILGFIANLIITLFLGGGMALLGG